MATTPNPSNPDTPSQPLLQQQQQQQQPLQSPEAQRDARLRKLMYNSSLVICVACPVVALMPPRKMDLYTFGLGIAFFTSAGYAMEQRTGRGLLWHVSSRLPSVKRRERQRAAREAEEEERDAEARRMRERDEARRRARQAEEEKRERERGFFWRLWMSGEPRGEDWVGKRAEKEREAAEEGKGYGSLIVEQVRDAFWGKSEEEEEDDDDDEQV